jgi:two-component system, sensor histidine kinase and response regulator
MNQQKPHLPSDEHILIVEDSPTQRVLLRHILEQHGYRIHDCSDGREALHWLQQNRPSLIISDILMPEMDGYQFCMEIKSTPALHDVPVILLTSLSDPKDIIEGLVCGADNFLVKPYDEDYLLSRLDYILANRNLQSRERAGEGVEISLAGKKYLIRAERRQILDLLLSTYEAAVRQNQQLIQAQNQLKQLNQRLEGEVEERTAKLKETNQSLESFCYTIAHDLRGPLRALQGFSTALSEDYSEVLDQTGLDYTSRISAAATRMDHLIHDLLLFGRLSHANLPLRKIELQEALPNLLHNLKDIIGSKKADVQIVPPLPAVWANLTVLEQVLTNLLSNAIKFVPPERNPEIKIWAEEKPKSSRLFIKDNGLGIAPEHQNRIFDVFERLHLSDQFPGTGIGLAIVRKGVERMGGKVGLESELGSGSIFWMKLPKGPPASDSNLK